MPNTLSKKQRLKSELKISELFSQGKTLIAYPLRICYLSNNGDENCMMVSVPKKLFKRAVKRNLLKRRIREAYRLNQTYLDTNNRHIDIAFSYIDPEILSFYQIQKAVIKALQKIKI